MIHVRLSLKGSVKFFGYDDVIKWKHIPRYWPFARVIHRSPGNSPHKGQWSGALMVSLICARINSWVNNGKVSMQLALVVILSHVGCYDLVCSSTLFLKKSWLFSGFVQSSSGKLLPLCRSSYESKNKRSTISVWLLCMPVIKCCTERFLTHGRVQGKVCYFDFTTMFDQFLRYKVHHDVQGSICDIHNSPVSLLFP